MQVIAKGFADCIRRDTWPKEQKRGLICNSANKGSGSIPQKGSVYSCSIPPLPLQIGTFVFIPLEDGTYA